jgi:hypothetical protein
VEVVQLAALGEQAEQLAQIQIPDAVLRQVDTDLTQTIFHFTDPAATTITQISVPRPEAPPEEWSVKANLISPLLGNTEPALDLPNLKIGPNRVAQAIKTQWPGCELRGITLYREGESNALTWIGFCKIPEGLVSGSMDAKTGVFQPSKAPPAVSPSTAIPLP